MMRPRRMYRRGVEESEMRVQRLARGAASVVVAAAILLASAAGAQSFWDDTLTYEQGLAATRRAHDRDQMSLQPRLPPARRALYREPPSTQQRCGRGDMGSVLGA